MIHVLTSSYAKDFKRAFSLNQRLLRNGVTHHLFVEHADLAQFNELGNIATLIHLKPDGGEGGLGRAGTMARFPCYLKMFEYLKEGDTYVQIDSDVQLIDDEVIIPALACEPDEVKGFFNPKYPTHLQRAEQIETDIRFFAMSGMMICAGWQVFKDTIPKDEKEMTDVIDGLLSVGFTPSEDVVLSYLLQNRYGVKLTNFMDTFWRVFHSNGDIEVLKWIDKKRFRRIFEDTFENGHPKMTKDGMNEFVTLPLWVQHD